ncbi:MAG: copper-binding protein [Providencia heimbachae]|uniref:copper-binding protein n=1 Tax=Providencia heimbachae TaxID=333962 RepID=UPI0010BEC49D|nr:copper-binding protein [Providencia heimbachae]MDD9341118.1 copper-binding protein [Providencia heimbachae]QCJ68959.1 cation transporter [Providencia heimbachae]
MKKLNKVVFALSLTFFTAIGYANTLEHNHSVYPEHTAEPIINTEGKLISIDKENKKLTINHKEIESIGWPPMTMRFTYENEKMIDGLNVDDELKFSFSQKGNISLLKSVEKKN